VSTLAAGKSPAGQPVTKPQALAATIANLERQQRIFAMRIGAPACGPPRT
jgi:hypothetical protein